MNIDMVESSRMSFTYTDNFGTEVKLDKFVPDIDIYDNPCEVLVEGFRGFLLACGFTAGTIEQYIKN